jgi:hypothetical protein
MITQVTDTFFALPKNLKLFGVFRQSAVIFFEIQGTTCKFSALMEAGSSLVRNSKIILDNRVFVMKSPPLTLPSRMASASEITEL